MDDHCWEDAFTDEELETLNTTRTCQKGARATVQTGWTVLQRKCCTWKRSIHAHLLDSKKGVHKFGASLFVT